MAFSVNNTQLKITGAEHAILSVEIDGNLVDFTAYNNSMADTTADTPYTASVSGYSTEADAFSKTLATALRLTGATESLTLNTALPFLAKAYYTDSTRKILWARDVDGTPTISEVAESRYFTTFNNAVYAEIDLSSLLTINGPFEVEIRCPYSLNDAVFGGNDLGTMFSFNQSDYVQIRINNVIKEFGTPTNKNGLIRWVIKRDANDNVELFADGELTGANTLTGPFELDTLGCHGLRSSQWFDGIIADFKIWDGDRETGTLVLDMPIDKQYEMGDIVENKVAVLGGELWVNPPPLIQSGWTYNGDDTYTHTGGQSELQINTGNPLKPSTAYLVTITASGEGSVSVQLGGAPNDGDNKAVNLPLGDNSVVLTTNSTITFNAIRILSSTETVVSNISIKEIPAQNPVGTAINITSEHSELFTFDVAGRWLGQELIINGGFDTDTNWTKGAGWSIANGVATHVAPNKNAFLISTGILTTGTTYLASLDLTDYTSGNANFHLGGSAWGPSMTSVGKHEVTLTAGGPELRVNASSANDFEGSIDNISVKRVLEY